MRKPAVKFYKLSDQSDGVNISEPGASEQFLDRHNDPPGHGKPSAVRCGCQHYSIVHTGYAEHDMTQQKPRIFASSCRFSTASEAASSAAASVVGSVLSVATSHRRFLFSGQLTTSDD